MIIVHMRHVRQVNYCSRQTRVWFAAQNLDYTKFLREGIDASILEATGDAIAMVVVQAARDEAAENEVANG